MSSLSNEKFDEPAEIVKNKVFAPTGCLPPRPFAACSSSLEQERSMPGIPVPNTPYDSRRTASPRASISLTAGLSKDTKVSAPSQLPS